MSPILKGFSSLVLEQQILSITFLKAGSVWVLLILWHLAAVSNVCFMKRGGVEAIFEGVREVSEKRVHILVQWCDRMTKLRRTLNARSLEFIL